MATNEEPYPDADPALSYDSARFQLTAQLSSIDSINQSYAVLISLATALIAIIAAAFGIRAGQPDTDIPTVAYGLVGCAAVIYLASLAFLWLASQTRYFKTGLTGEEAWQWAEEYRDHPRVLYWWATRAAIVSLELNLKDIQQKKSRGTTGQVLLLLELCVGVAAIGFLL